MKTLSTTLLILLCGFYVNAQISLIDAKGIGNIEYNSIEFLRSLPTDNIMVAGITSQPTDVSLNGGIPRVINANSLQDIFWMEGDNAIQNTTGAGLINGTNYNFIQDLQVIKGPGGGALFGMNTNAGVLNIVGSSPINFATAGGVAFNTDANANVENYLTIQSSVAAQISQVKECQTDWLVTGSYGGNMSLGSYNLTSIGTRDGFIGKWNPLITTPQWLGEVKAFGFNSFDRIFYNENSNEVVACGGLAASGNYVCNSISTPLSTSSFGNTVFILRLNATDGSYVNHTIFGSVSNVNPFGILENAGGVYFAGNMNDDVYPDRNNTSTVIQGFGNADQLLLKFSPSLTYETARVSGGAESDIGRNLREFTKSHSGIMATAGFRTDVLSGGGINQQACIEMFDEFLNLIATYIFGGNGYEMANDVDVDSIGNIFIAGYFQDTVDMDPGPGVFNLISAGGFDAFVAKYDATTLGLSEVQTGKSGLELFPVPADNLISVRGILRTSRDGILTVLDLNGREVYYEVLHATSDFKRDIYIKNLSDGVYFLQLKTSEEVMMKKFLIAH